MSAPSDSATSPSPCACTNISLMQLFHELKQKFPGVPDHVVSNTIELYCHDKKACETHLHREVKASLTHAYHASSSAAARQLNELKLNPPIKCRNQPIIKHEVAKCTAVKALTCQGPQKAEISTTSDTEEEKPKLNTDANQNVVECNNIGINELPSPVTVINIDNCYAKYSAGSPSDLELTNENKIENHIIDRGILKEPQGIQEESTSHGVQQDSTTDSIKQETATHSEHQEGTSKVTTPDITNVTDSEQSENTNYRILKSNKIRSNLNEKLEVLKEVKEKKTIKKDNTNQPVKPPQEKPQRPKTLNFIKPNPDIAFKDNLKHPEAESCRTVSPAPSTQKQENKEQKGSYRQDRNYPLNWSVNVNCHMDLSHDGDYDSPRAITSVNLTVCTPTSNMASPVRDVREDEGAFEGHVTVTVSPSTTRPVRRRAPPPPMQASRLESPRPTRMAPEPPTQSQDRSLIERQKERLSRLASALAQEKGRLAQLNRETQILAAPPPTPSAAQRLKDYVERLRDECDMLAKRLEIGGGGARVIPVAEVDDTSNFYSNIYTGQRQPTSWQCHMCTFRNHPLLDKCEECDMPRIFVGTSPATTHDSGFGSFREKNRREVSKDTTDITDSHVSHVRDQRAVNV